MDEPATAILGRMFGPDVGTPGLPILDLSPWLKLDAEPLAQVTAAFLVAAAGPAHPDRDQAMAVLAGPAAPAAGHAAHLVAGPAAAAAEPAAPAAGASADLASFYRDGLERMAAELSRVTAEEPRVAARLGAAAAALNAATSADEAREGIWGVFFPQAVGIQGHEEERIRDLRSARTVTVTRPAPDPMTNPGRDVAVKQLTLNPATENSNGLRVGSLVQIRDIMDEELESVWSGKKNAKQALDDAVARGNRLLRDFEAANK